MIKSIIFDFDGTLADTLPIFIGGVNKLSEQYKYEKITNPDPFRKSGIKHFLKKDLGLNNLQLLFFIQKIKKIIKEELYQSKLFEGIPEIIKILQKKYHLGIISGNKKTVIQKVINQHKINYFSPIYGETRIKKQRYIKKFLHKHNYKRNEVIYIGDGIGDIISAQKAGIAVIAVGRGFHHPEALKAYKPNFFVERPSEILDILG